MAQLAPSPPVRTKDDTSLVDWTAVIAGALLASALSFVLLTFGSAIGLSATSPWPSSGLPASAIASLAVFWTMAQQILAFLIGGYVAARLSSRWRGTDPDEAVFRDGMHGALVWALGIALGTALALAAVGALMRAGTDGPAKGATSAVATADPMELAVDAMLRPGAGIDASGRAGALRGDARPELARILASSVALPGLSSQNRAYLAQRVAEIAGLSQQDAEGRVREAVAATRRAADTARRAAVLTGLVTATSLLASLGAAWWAAVKGGQHREASIPPSLISGLRRRYGVQRT